MADEHRPKDPRDPLTTGRDDAASRRDEKDPEPGGAEKGRPSTNAQGAPSEVEGRDRPPSHPDRDQKGPWLGGG